MSTLTDIETKQREGARSVDLKRSLVLDKERSYSNGKDDNRSDGNNSQKSGGVLSWLNKSFFSFKSGKSSKVSGGEDCLCGYREKYNQYKYQSISLKNQL